jgi:hypothetical protein
MNDTCGPMCEMPLAQYDPAERCWKTSEATSLWALPMSSLTLPPWGCLHDGELYELPTPAHLTTGHGFSSLPTPTGDDASNATRASGSFQSLTRSVVMLPTPAVNDMGAGKDPEAWDEWTQRMREAHGNGNGHGKSLEQEALKMLPTPSAQEPGYTGPLVDKDGQPATHAAQRCYDPATGRLAQTGVFQAVRMLPTPLAEMGRLQRDDFTPNLRTVIEGNAMLPGATTHPPLNAGSTSSDDQHQPQLFNETTATD